MPRAYSPRMSTTLLMAQIAALDGIASVRAIAPTAGRPTRLRITLERPGPIGRYRDAVYSDFTLADARAWLEAEYAYASRPLTVTRGRIGGAYR